MKLEILVLTLCSVCYATVNYDGFRVYRVIPTNIHQLSALRELPETYQFWSEPGNLYNNVDVMVASDQKNEFEEFLLRMKLRNSIMIQNVQELINAEQIHSSEFNWKSYHNITMINSWLRSLEVQYPGVVKVIVGGESFEGREILGVHISFQPGNRAVFLEATVTFIINELLTNTDSSVRRVIESRDWYIFPSVNPDGYEYSRNTDRMWRKTTTIYERCNGADANRNWDYHWMDGGASNNTCSETHAGPKPFSEKETKTLSNYIVSVIHDLDAYISFHSYSQLLLIPFGHQGLEVPENNDQLHAIGNKAMKKLAERYGTKYTVGNKPNVLGYIGSGGSIDWIAGVHKVKLVYTFELRDTGKHGFILPPDQIIPTGLETFDGVIQIIDEYDASNNYK
ncbi:hypothetical protein RN001_015431 [Aquatica leii]|uniref:Zinc carboxypeptidase A 1 n=1 Tax=Aquatica leii TaxID=1421715 RepID=A0AAN7NZ20_9COLE|nr:hypothetical protein RN001_015431 [Aquatica leii]